MQFARARESSPSDPFALMGLLGVIRMTDPDLTTLALGTDLTGLGLHLNSPQDVYCTFASPWAEQPLKPEPEFLVRAAYTSLVKSCRGGFDASICHASITRHCLLVRRLTQHSAEPASHPHAHLRALACDVLEAGGALPLIGVRAVPQVPECYRHSPARLQPGYLSKFQVDTLFYIFYSMPNDEAQVLAADELRGRGWLFHKEFKVCAPTCAHLIICCLPIWAALLAKAGSECQSTEQQEALAYTVSS